MAKFTDSRPPVSVTRIGKYTVTIFDQEAYDRSLLEYPDDGKSLNVETLSRRRDNSKPAFTKQKPAARYNWITKLDKPLGGIE